LSLAVVFIGMGAGRQKSSHGPRAGFTIASGRDDPGWILLLCEVGACFNRLQSEWC
jgi:hypothetical protein